MKWFEGSLPANFDKIFKRKQDIDGYNTTSTTHISNDVSTITSINTLHIEPSRLKNFGQKSMRVSGPSLWKRLPRELRNLTSFPVFKNSIKSLFISRYSPARRVYNHFFISNLSICGMKMTASKMNTFFIPQYLPARKHRVSFVSEVGMKLRIKICKLGK